MRKKAAPADPKPDGLEVVYLPVDRITEYPNNSRQHSIEQIELIACSMKEYGWSNPCLIDANNELIAGAGRLQAAHKLGLTSIPCIRLGHLTPAQKRALVIADNKIAITGTQWDIPLLKTELIELKLVDFDLEATGFSIGELEDLFDEPAALPGAKGEPVGEKSVVCPACGHEF